MPTSSLRSLGSVPTRSKRRRRNLSQPHNKCLYFKCGYFYLCGCSTQTNGIDFTMIDSDPMITRKIYRSYLFGWLTFSYLCEDRRPDLVYEEARKQLGYKYKHQLSVRLFTFTFSSIIYSLSTASVWENGKELPT